jgi:adenine phosphoribosyltransferase
VSRTSTVEVMGDTAWLKDHVRDVADFPKPGIVFKDLTPLLADPAAFRTAVDAIADHVAGRRVDKVVGIEARGLILAAPVAYRLGAGFVPVRKTGKLPGPVDSEEYELEYGTDLLEVHRDAVSPGEHVLVVDDVLATGGTAAAATRLLERLGAHIVAVAFVIELDFLGGRGRLDGYDALSLLHYG